MFVNAHTPYKMLPAQLDNYLAMGWFRLGQNIFTTNFLSFADEFYSAYWLRLDLNLVETEHKILKRNKDFRIAINPFVLTEEKEVLFGIYRRNLPFPTAESLSSLLFNNGNVDIYNTYEICVYNDKNQLIGLGIYDLGECSAEGIVSIYHPNYKRYSLGKFLILTKIQHLKSLGYDYFYPGYFAPNYKIFDYKTELYHEATQYFSVLDQQWLPLTFFDQKSLHIETIKSKLSYLEGFLIENRVKVSMFKYDFFDMGMHSNYANLGLLDMPLFLFCFFTLNQQSGIIVYDIFLNKYQLLLCEKAYDVSQWEYKPGHFNEFILRPLTILAEDSSADILFEKAKTYFIFE